MVSKVYCNSLISFFVVVLGYTFIILGLSLLHWLMTRKLHGTKERKITTPMASYLTENRMKKKKKTLSKGACSIWPPNAFLCLSLIALSSVLLLRPYSTIVLFTPFRSPKHPPISESWDSLCQGPFPQACLWPSPSLPSSLCPAEEHLSTSLR